MAESIATSFNLTQGFPTAVFHPVYGRREVDSFEAIKQLPGVMTDWFRTADDADMARTQPEADAVLLNNTFMRVQEHAAATAKEGGASAAGGKPDAPAPTGTAGIVRDSVAAQEAADALARSIVEAGGGIPTGPAPAGMVPASEGATEGVKAAPAGGANPQSAHDVAEATRRSAASDVIPVPGQETDLAAGNKNDKPPAPTPAADPPKSDPPKAPEHSTQPHQEHPHQNHPNRSSAPDRKS